MAHTFSQIYIQVVFTVKGRENLISNNWKEDLYSYMGGIIKGKGQKPIIINGMPDHVHVFMGIRPSVSIADIVRDIKNNSSEYINNRKLIKGKFCWQEGYGVFSYSHSHIQKVYDYILRQEKHHKKRLLKKNTRRSWKNLTYPTKKNICLIGTTNYHLSFTPGGVQVRSMYDFL